MIYVSLDKSRRIKEMCRVISLLSCIKETYNKYWVVGCVPREIYVLTWKVLMKKQKNKLCDELSNWGLMHWEAGIFTWTVDYANWKNKIIREQHKS